MSDYTIQYISLGISGIQVAYTCIQHVFHCTNNKSNNIQQLDQNIQNIKDLFQKLIYKNLFNKEAKDIQNQVENILTYDYDKIKETVQNERNINSQTITTILNVLGLSQNMQNHINQQMELAQASNNQLNNVRKTLQSKLKDERISIYEIKPNN